MGYQVGVLALQGAFALHAAALERLGASPVEVRQAVHLESVDGLIIPGGESTTMAKLLVSQGVMEPLVERLADNMPVFGTCAGMILLAADVLDGRSDQQSLGAIDIGVRRNAYGRQIDSFEAPLEVTDRLDMAALGRPEAPITGVFIRAPGVERLGDGVEVLATVEDRPVLCRQGATLVSSFHPELTGDDRVHQLFLASL